MITDDVIACWRTNYGLEDRTPAEAAAWWESKAGHAPSGAVAALGTCIDEIALLRAGVENLERANAEAEVEISKLRLEHEAMTRSRDDWQSVAVHRTANLEQYSRLAENDIAELMLERDEWKALAAAADTDKRKAEEVLAAARADIAAAQSDAERYRWLRGDAPEYSERWSRWNLQRWDGGCWHSLERTALDSAIDASLAAKEW